MQRLLVERAQAGDLEAFAQLVKASAARLKGVAYLILRDEHRAEDALQDALSSPGGTCARCETPMPGTPGFDGSRCNACYKVAAKERRRSHVEQHVAPAPDSVRTPDAASGVAEREWVLSELDRLDIDRRAVLVLHYYLDLPLTEVAENPGHPLRDGHVPSPSRPRGHAPIHGGTPGAASDLAAERSR